MAGHKCPDSALATVSSYKILEEHTQVTTVTEITPLADKFSKY